MSTPPTRPAAASTPADADVLIVGAGPAGLALACALADAGLSARLLELQPRAALDDPPEDGREIAITHRARRVMEQSGLWQALPAAEIAPLREAQVLDGNSHAPLRFTPAATAGADETLGWLVPNHLIRAAALRCALARPAVSLQDEARVTALNLGDGRPGELAEVLLADGQRLRAPLVVAADSRFSRTRGLAGIGASMHDFGRGVIVARLAHEGDNGGIARECFRYGNTLALLPMNERQSSAVVTVGAEQIGSWMALPEAEFAARIQAQAGGRLGTMRLVSPRHHYPLVGVYAHRFATRRFALIGDAAVGMHPVTAHGWNFGLYGIEVLARELKAARAAGRDIGALPALQNFERAHRLTTLPVYLGTNAVVSLFTDERPLPKLARRAVLALAEHAPPFSGLIKAAMRRQLTGQGGGFALPRPPWALRPATL